VVIGVGEGAAAVGAGDGAGAGFTGTGAGAGAILIVDFSPFQTEAVLDALEVPLGSVGQALSKYKARHSLEPSPSRRPSTSKGETPQRSICCKSS